jgi:hypothetical protein
MLRINLLVAVTVAAGVVGCAQCDTCDDFPAPGASNYGMPYGVPAAMSDPGGSQGAPVTGPSTPASPTGDAAGAAPVAPADSGPPAVPPAGSGAAPATPPVPMDPFTQPK